MNWRRDAQTRVRAKRQRLAPEVDYQPSQFAGVHSIDHDLLVDSVVSTVKIAKADTGGVIVDEPQALPTPGASASGRPMRSRQPTGQTLTWLPS